MICLRYNHLLFDPCAPGRPFKFLKNGIIIHRHEGSGGNSTWCAGRQNTH